MIDKEGKWNLNWQDDLVKGTCITYNGEIVNDKVKSAVKGHLSIGQ
jgi:H+-translocating NAD(P) transhydrogenase subunit alpha